MASGSKDSGRTKPHTRSAGPIYDIDIAFQENKIYYPTRQLPTLGGVIGMLRYHTSPRKLCTGKNRSKAIREVAKQLYAKWFHDSIPCIDYETLVKRLTKLLSVVQEGAKRQKQGIEERKVVKEYKKLVENKDKLYDIFPRKLNGEEDKEKRRKVEEDWGENMSKLD